MCSVSSWSSAGCSSAESVSDECWGDEGSIELGEEFDEEWCPEFMVDGGEITIGTAASVASKPKEHKIRTQMLICTYSTFSLVETTLIGTSW